MFCITLIKSNENYFFRVMTPTLQTTADFNQSIKKITLIFKIVFVYKRASENEKLTVILAEPFKA